MKIKMLRLGIKNIEDTLKDSIDVMKRLEGGQDVTPEKGIYFTSLKAFRKALTPKRLALLHTIKATKPTSINQLAEIAGRDIKNVVEDIKYLEEIGLVERKKTATTIEVNYDKISLEIAV
ncbi:MAG: MarR family transcriptional regulator [Nitrospirota bacterium]